MKRINCRVLAAALLAIQVAVAAMPATALACENEQIQEIAQQDAEAAAGTIEENDKSKETEPAEKIEEVKEETAETNAKDMNAAKAEAPMEKEAPENEADTAETASVPEAEETEKEEEANDSETPEKSEQVTGFEQIVTVDRVKIKVTAEKNAFEEGAKLSAARVPSIQLKEVENAVANTRAKDEIVTSAYAFDIKVMSKDGRSLQPAAGTKIKVSFETEEAVDDHLSAVVYHIVGPKENITAKKLVTTVNRKAKAAEAQTDGLSYYVVEFVSKNSVDAGAKTETSADANMAKTDPVNEEKSTKTETVTPAAEETAKSGTEVPVVTKETKAEAGKSQVKEAKRPEDSRKKETAKKEKAGSKKTEKAKTTDKKSPATGDSSNTTVWAAMSLFAAAGIIVLLAFRRKLR